MQRDRSHTYQACFCWLMLVSIHGKVLDILEMCYFACVSSVRALKNLLATVALHGVQSLSERPSARLFLLSAISARGREQSLSERPYARLFLLSAISARGRVQSLLEKTQSSSVPSVSYLYTGVLDKAPRYFSTSRDGL